MMNTRIGREFFNYLVLILARNSLFYSPHKPQRPIKYQLAVFLIQYGQRASDTLDIAAKLSIADCGNALTFCVEASLTPSQQRPHLLGSGD
jgi:hypothetical protein